jgi:hypothetical protein
MACVQGNRQAHNSRILSRRQQTRLLAQERHTRQRHRREVQKAYRRVAMETDTHNVSTGPACERLKVIMRQFFSDIAHGIPTFRCPCPWRRTVQADTSSDSSGETEPLQVQVLTLEQVVSYYDFGPEAFGPLEPLVAESESWQNSTDDTRLKVQGQITALVLESVPAVRDLRGQRGERLVTEMLTACYGQGLWMHGPPDSPLNSLIVPAMRHIFQEMMQLPPSHGKRVGCFSTLAYACQDCQQVQAREILRIHGDLTSQNATLEKQLKYSLVRDKEAALHRLISERHPRCDLDWTQVKPWQQRPHLMSGYTFSIGEAFGLDSVTTARSDRFLSNAQSEIGEIDCEKVVLELKQSMSVRGWLQMLLADINNQTEGADRLIDRNCIFNWVQANMDTESAYSVFYDEDRRAEFVDLDPQEPASANRFQPFLSLRVLVDILLSAGMLEKKVAEKLG